MFQTRTGHISATLFMLALSAQPMTASATGPSTSASLTQAQFEVHNIASAKNAHLLQGKTFDKLQYDAKAKFSETQRDIGVLVDNLDDATNKLQNRMSPIGQSLKASLKSKLPGTSVVERGDRTFSVFGLILMMSFALVIFLMGLSNPVSRLGGRH